MFVKLFIMVTSKHMVFSCLNVIIIKSITATSRMTPTIVLTIKLPNSKTIYISQWRSQNAEKVTHIKGRQLVQAVDFFHCVSVQNGNFRGSEFFTLRAVPYGMEKSLLPHYVTSLECNYFITHMRYCIMEATPMSASHLITYQLSLGPWKSQPKTDMIALTH